MSDETIARSEAYLDTLFGEGMGRRHSRFLDRLGHAGTADALHRYHGIEADETWISVEENYLIGLCVLCAQGRWGPAGMFARTLAHRGVPAPRILEAVARLEMWIGGIGAAEAVGRVRSALRDYERDGLDSMRGWFPEDRSDD